MREREREEIILNDCCSGTLKGRRNQTAKPNKPRIPAVDCGKVLNILKSVDNKCVMYEKPRGGKRVSRLPKKADLKRSQFGVEKRQKMCAHEAQGRLKHAAKKKKQRKNVIKYSAEWHSPTTPATAVDGEQNCEN